MENEEEIIGRAKKGDRAAFEKIVEAYKNYIFAIILNFTRDNNEVENIAQEVFLQIYLSLNKYESDNFKGWISRLTSNKTIDYMRSKKRHFKEEVIDHSEEVIEKIRINEVETPEESLVKNEREEEIMKICRSLSPIYRETILKFYMEGKSYEEIAEEEGVTEKTIASRLYRGRNMMKEKWRNENEAL